MSFRRLPGFGVVGRIGAYTAERCGWWRRKVAARRPSWDDATRASVRSMIVALRDHQITSAAGAEEREDQRSSTPAVSLGSASA